MDKVLHPCKPTRLNHKEVEILGKPTMNESTIKILLVERDWG
jgi:hypothetical protein